MIRTASTALAFATVLCLVAQPADARSRKKADPDASESTKTSEKKKEMPAGKPAQVATFGDWGAFLAKGKAKTCYALASPKERKPEGKHDAAYVFIADRPGEKVHNEVSIIMGFPMKESASASAKVGKTSFELVAKGANAWIKNPGDEAKFVEALKHGGKLVVKASPTKGKETTDIYSLDGLKPALERVSKDCK